ncbi:zinc finger protein 624 [Trichonephila clavata]|uniref:Zinc finger protein 624 n=1 Tax=Trichonephila clavata TaxID=2740835 RepID=A0A8X6EYB8_TRICU|nr:zinc finger protein 624 [Trichonephila clavata]
MLAQKYIYLLKKAKFRSWELKTFNKVRFVSIGLEINFPTKRMSLKGCGGISINNIKRYHTTEWISSNVNSSLPRNISRLQDCFKFAITEPKSVNFKMFPNPPRTCSDCGKTFTRQNNLDDLPLKYADISGDIDFPEEDNHAASFLAYYHLNETENIKNQEHDLSILKEKSFKCVRCLKSFRYRTSLFQHVCEGGLQKGFRCKECGKTLARKSSLIGHLRIHTGEKPFKCEHCGKAFTHKHHLHSHMHRHRE